MTTTRKQHTVTESEAGRADRIVQVLTGLSRARTRALFQHGCVYRNGKPCPDDFAPVSAGDRIEVRFDPRNVPREKRQAWHDPAFGIVHEDEHLIVVDKAAHVLTVPAGDGDKRTLLHAVNEYLRRTGRHTGAQVMQRLDRGTSGLLVLAKTDPAYQRLRNQFAQHTVDRQYLAIVAGVVEKEKGSFRSYLKTGMDLSRYSVPHPDSQDSPAESSGGRDTFGGRGASGGGGELAVTHYEVVEHRPDMTLVRCHLETGRRNQIRVHFAEAGHPVLGDDRYKHQQARHPRWRAKRLALHATILGFTHPDTGQPMRFESPMPREFAQTLGRRSSEPEARQNQ